MKKKAIYTLKKIWDVSLVIIWLCASILMSVWLYNTVAYKIYDTFPLGYIQKYISDWAAFVIWTSLAVFTLLGSIVNWKEFEYRGKFVIVEERYYAIKTRIFFLILINIGNIIVWMIFRSIPFIIAILFFVVNENVVMNGLLFSVKSRKEIQREIKNQIEEETKVRIEESMAPLLRERDELSDKNAKLDAEIQKKEEILERLNKRITESREFFKAPKE